MRRLKWAAFILEKEKDEDLNLVFAPEYGMEYEGLSNCIQILRTINALQNLAEHFIYLLQPESKYDSIAQTPY